MNAQMKSEEKPAECAACGGPIVKPVGTSKEFCSLPCYQSGRSSCKLCGIPIIQPSKKGFKRQYCSGLCRQKWYERIPYNPSYLTERQRTTCKGCGMPITQPKNGAVKQFCTPSCNQRWRRVKERKQNITEEWGSFTPEVRKAIKEVQLFMGLPAAQRLASAIDREYIRRDQRNPRNIRGAFTIHACKACGKEFRRRTYGYKSKDYCSSKCYPSRRLRGEETYNAKLTWEQVDEIRHLSTTEKLSHHELAKKYDVGQSTISSILSFQTWKPIHDPRTVNSENASQAKLTWEEVNEIRRLYETGQMSQPALAAKYDRRIENISSIVNYNSWKPENDPRRKDATS